MFLVWFFFNKRYTFGRAQMWTRNLVEAKTKNIKSNVIINMLQRRNWSLNRPIDKENIPPPLAQNTSQKLTRTNKSITISQRSKWTIIKVLKNVMDTMGRKVTSLRKTNQFWNMPLKSLLNHFNGKIKSKKHGPQVC